MTQLPRRLTGTDSLLLIAFIVLLCMIVATSILAQHDRSAIDSYRECTQAGNPVQLSYPSVCTTPDGRRFVNPDERVTLPAQPVPL
jgi:hypothetical protein